MKHFENYVILICLFIVSCNSNYSESVYCLDGYSIVRQDWNDCMTKLTYIDNGTREIGSALFYYPGRDGWFIIDNIWGDNCVYVVLCEACPKIIIRDSSRFIIKHDYQNIPVEKNRWRRISSDDDYPVIQRKNEEYGTNVKKKEHNKGVYNNKMPDWEKDSGMFYSSSILKQN